jgi:predicted lipoprotein with Yx(FWY)xxD motif
MKRTPPGRRSLFVKLLVSSVALVALAATLAACGGGGGSTSAAYTMSGGTAGTAGGSTVSVQSIGDAGRVLVDSSGQALYASDLEANGKVLCSDACNSFWQPLTAGGGAPSKSSSLAGKLGVVKRPDGSRQVTYAGMPLYSFTQEGPEEVTGDGFVDAFGGHQFTWSVVDVGGGSSESVGSEAEGESSSTGGRSYSY